MQETYKKKVTDDVAGLPISPEDITVIAQKITNYPFIKVLNYGFDVCSKQKLGLSGDHHYLNLSVQNQGESSVKKLKVFVKSIPYSCQTQTEFVKSQGIFNKEISFFKNIVPLLTDNYKGEKWSATCYFAKNDVLVMEDLKSQGYKLSDTILNETPTLKSGLSALARFHGCSILAEARLSQQAKRPVQLNEYYPETLNDNAFTNRHSKSISAFENGVEISTAIAERLGFDPQKVRAGCNRFLDLVKPSKNHRNAICHGDLWTNNLMFDDTAPLPKCVLVDFQVVKYAPMVLDVLEFLYLNSTRAYRSKYESELIEHYHEVLEMTINSSDATNSAKVPSLKEISAQFEDLRLFGPVIASYYFPFVLLEQKVRQKEVDVSEIYENYVFGDRKSETLKFMDENEFFKQRFEDVIVELGELSEHVC